MHGPHQVLSIEFDTADVEASEPFGATPNLRADVAASSVPGPGPSIRLPHFAIARTSPLLARFTSGSVIAAVQVCPLLLGASRGLMLVSRYCFYWPVPLRMPPGASALQKYA